MKIFTKKLAAFFLVIHIVHFTLYIDNCNAQWVQTNGPYGGDISCFAVSGSNLFAGTNSSGVFLSTNYGGNWTSVNSGLSYSYVGALTAVGQNIFAGIQNSGVSPGGVFLSTNKGTNWIAAGLSGNSINSIAINGLNVFAGTYDSGVFRSTNNGLSWIEANNGLTVSYVYCLVVNDSYIFAGTVGGMFRSSNNGTNWVEVNNGLNSASVISLAVKGTYIFAGTGVGSGVFISTNNGNSWISRGLWNYNILSLTASGGNIFAATSIGGGIFRSTNDGADWIAVFSGPYFSDLATIGSNLFAGNASGVVYSTNSGATWTLVNSGLTNSEIYEMTQIGGNLFASSRSGCFISDNNGTVWTDISSGINNNGFFNPLVNSFVSSGTNLFAGGNGVYRSTNSGTNWTAVNSGITDPSISSLAENNNFIFAGSYNDGVFRSSNNGTNWNAINSGITDLHVNSLAVLGNNIFAGCGTWFGTGSLFRSTNNGTNWFQTGLSDVSIFCLGLSETNIFAATDSGKIFFSSDYGESWTEADSGIFNYSYVDITSFAASGSNVFAGTYLGIFLTTNNGKNWNPVNTGLTNIYAGSLAVSGTNLFAGTIGSSVWKRPLSEMIVSVTNLSTDLPSDFNLLQNYPNPFNPVTNLEFGISDLGFVSLKVYDILGKEVATLVNEKLSPGNYKVEFDGSGLTSGVYFYRLTAGEFTETKRMMLIK